MPNIDEVRIELSYEFFPFFQAMIDEIVRHFPEKGFSYRNKTWLLEGLEEIDAVDGFHAEIIRAFDEWRQNKDPHQFVDIAALMAMSWLHETDRIKEVLLEEATG